MRLTQRRPVMWKNFVFWLIKVDKLNTHRIINAHKNVSLVIPTMLSSFKIVFLVKFHNSFAEFSTSWCTCWVLLATNVSLWPDGKKSFISGMPVGFHYWSRSSYMLFDYHLIIYVGKCVARYLRSVGNWSALLLITRNLVPVSLTKYLVIFKTRTSQSRRTFVHV